MTQDEQQEFDKAVTELDRYFGSTPPDQFPTNNFDFSDHPGAAQPFAKYVESKGYNVKWHGHHIVIVSRQPPNTATIAWIKG